MMASTSAASVGYWASPTSTCILRKSPGADKTIDVVVDIFNRVNSGGTKLSKGDLALAKICADGPRARGDEGGA